MPFNKFFKFLKRKKKATILVSGLPRSGTSMMMQILEAGGLSPVSDGARPADVSNPKGYYEHEAVKKLAKGNFSSLVDSEGRAIKVISSLLQFLPTERHYKIIFMQREMGKILKSQAKMLLELKQPVNSDNDDKMNTLYAKHLAKTYQWLTNQNNIDVIYVNYEDILEAPEAQLNRIKDFAALPGDIRSMVACIDKRLRHH